MIWWYMASKPPFLITSKFCRMTNSAAGKFDTSFVETHPELTQYQAPRPKELLAVAIASAIAAHEGL